MLKQTGVTPDKPGEQQASTATQNGQAERDNQRLALARVGAQANATAGRIVQEAKATGKAGGYADVDTMRWKAES